MDELHLALSPTEIGRIVGFLGYGRTSAPVWFIGLEEGLGKMNSDDTIKNLKARASFDETMDLREAHLRLVEKGRPIDIEMNPPNTQVWKYMAKIMVAISGGDWKNRRSVNEYIRFRLGRVSGETFLTELSPIPSRKVRERTWRELFEKLDPELEENIERRTTRLKQVARENTSSLIICYGTKRAGDFEEILGVRWHDATAQIRMSQEGRYLLLPFFGNGQMSHSVIGGLISKGLLTLEAGRP